MGSNRRYSSDVTDAAIHEAVLRPQPISLTDREVGEGITEAKEPVAVTAFVRFPETSIEVKAEVIAWTRRAVRIRWTMRNGGVRTAWVWASAVERLGVNRPAPR